MTVYVPPGQPGSVVSYESRYDNWIGGERVAPVKGQYFENVSPVNGQVVLPKSPAPPQQMSTSRWTPPTKPRRPGARPRPPSARSF